MDIRSTPPMNPALLQQGPDSSRYLPNSSNRSPGSNPPGVSSGASSSAGLQALPQASPPSRPSTSVEVQISDAARQAAANDPSPGLRGRASTADEALPPVPPQTTTAAQWGGGGRAQGSSSPASATMAMDQSGAQRAGPRSPEARQSEGLQAQPPTYGSRRAIQMFREVAGLGLANPQANSSVLRSFA
jgi:hypothetical protein